MNTMLQKLSLDVGHKFHKKVLALPITAQRNLTKGIQFNSVSPLIDDAPATLDIRCISLARRGRDVVAQQPRALFYF